MKGEIFHSEQPILTEDLALAQSSKEDALRERFTDLFTPGVIEGTQLFPQDVNEPVVFNVIPGSNNTVGNPTITVRTGIGLSALGERVVISGIVAYENPVVTGSTVTSGNPLAPDGTINGPLTTSDNGISGWTLTPRSSGSENIPLIQNQTNRIWLGYLQTIDPTVFTLQEFSNERLFTRANDGYEIRVTTSAINPDSSKYFLIAEVAVTNTVVSTAISYTKRQVSLTKPKRVGIKLNAVNKPTSYSDGAATLSSIASGSFSVNTLTFIVSVNGGSDQTVTFSGTDPISINAVANAIQAGVVGLTAQVVSNTIKLIAENSIQIKNGTSNAVLGFTNGQSAVEKRVPLDDHINSVGSGVVSPNNPHGISASDLGIVNLADVGAKLNSSGVITPDADTTTSSLYAVATSSGTPQDNIITFKALSALESVNVNGVIISNIDLPADVSFKFVDSLNVPIANGIYTFYIDKTSKQILRSLPNQVINSPDAFLLARITWTSPSLVLPPTDLRLFGTTASNNLRFETLTSLAEGLASANRVTSITYDSGNGDRISSMTIAGEGATIAGTDVTVTFGYAGPGGAANLTSISAQVGNRTLTTTISYNMDQTVNTITESVI